MARHCGCVYATEESAILECTYHQGVRRDLTSALLKLDEQTKIVARIWEVLGSPDYDELKGRSIYEVIQGWIDRAISYETRLSSIQTGLNDVLVRNGDGKVSNADAMSELHELFYQWFQARLVENQRTGCDGKHGPPDCNDRYCWRGPIMNA